MRIAIGLYEQFTSLDVMGPFQVLSGSAERRGDLRRGEGRTGDRRVRAS